MKHIQSLPMGGWDFDGYFQYIESVRGNFPPEIYQFASNPKNFDLISHQSLHDAWLEWLLVSEPATGSRTEVRAIQIETRFLGRFHDQYIEMIYLGVSGYKLSVLKLGSQNHPMIGHGDLLMHEVRIEDAEIVHELIFSTGSQIEISCRSFEYRVIPRISDTT